MGRKSSSDGDLNNRMNALIGKTPFFRLLLPVIAGIIAGSLFPGILPASLPVALAGLLLMLLSFFIRPDDQFRFRWLFGAGICFFLFSLSLYQFRQHTESTIPTPSRYGQYDLGTVLDIPEVKPRSIAVNVKTAPPDEKKVILYLAQTDEARGLIPGDEIVFLSSVEPFRNLGNPDDFDYAGYMRIKGFVGSGYVHGSDWRKTGRQTKSIPVMAQRFRGKALDFYRSFGLENDAYAFICALTLGYSAYLSDELNNAFRVSGTAHVLSVSGLHTVIIYAIINLMFSFLGKTGKLFVLRQWLVILVLWGYVFITGMLAPVIRAAIMLTIVCIGNMQNKSGFTYNTLTAAAFFILIFDPFYLFDLSFQMSFVSVFALLFFQPKLNRLYSPANRAVKYVWDLFTVSISAQLGVFPLVLYYFGTFPTYFFITNLLVVPLTGVIMYATLPAIVLGSLNFPGWDFIGLLHSACHWILKSLIEITLRIVYISESVPFAQISEMKISFSQLILLSLFIFVFTRFLSSRRARPLIISLVALLCFQCTITHKNLTRPAPQLTVFNSPGQSEIAVFHNNKRHYLEFPENSFLPHPEKRIFLLSDASFTTYHAGEQFPLDILILSQQGYFDIEQLLDLFCPTMIVLDSSLPRYAATRIVRECAALGIEVHDVTENGAFSLNF